MLYAGSMSTEWMIVIGTLPNTLAGFPILGRGRGLTLAWGNFRSAGRGSQFASQRGMPQPSLPVRTIRNRLAVSSRNHAVFLREAVTNCCKELVPSLYVQPEEAMLEAPLKKYRTINRLIDKVLSFLLGSK